MFKPGTLVLPHAGPERPARRDDAGPEFSRF